MEISIILKTKKEILIYVRSKCGVLSKRCLYPSYMEERAEDRKEKKQNQEIKIHNNFLKNWGPERDGWEGGFKAHGPLVSPVLLEHSKGVAMKRGCLIRALGAEGRRGDKYLDFFSSSHPLFCLCLPWGNQPEA